MDDYEIIMAVCSITLIGLIILLIIESQKKKKITKRDNLIQDNKASVELVLEKLKGFKPQVLENRKRGFTERDIQSQMEKYFKNIFQNVTREHGIESKNAKAIDFDIGNGKVGIEVKIGHELLKEGEWDRAIGQMVKYTRKKYDSDNFIVAVVGFENEFRDSMLSDIEDDVHSHKGHFCFITAEDIVKQ